MYYRKDAFLGFGDFIRGCLSFLSFCKRESIDFYIDLKELEHLEKCFEYKHNTYENLQVHKLVVDPEWSIDFIKNNIYDMIRYDKKHYQVINNRYGFEDSKSILDVVDLFNTYMKPSQMITDYIDKIYSTYNISKSKYISLHIRGGDQAFYGQISTNDERIDIYDIENIKNILSFDNTTVIHSDSVKIKQEFKDIKNTIILDIVPYHTQEDNSSIYETIAEFYIMAYASSIIQITYSGFSHWASILGKNKLYSYTKSKILDFMNTHTQVQNYNDKRVQYNITK